MFYVLLCCVGIIYIVFFFFFFQAEDGIRDRDVTGVQTCALPICLPSLELMATYYISGVPITERDGRLVGILTNRDLRFEVDKIGRASCRERVEISVVAVVLVKHVCILRVSHSIQIATTTVCILS